MNEIYQIFDEIIELSVEQPNTWAATTLILQSIRDQLGSLLMDQDQEVETC